MNPLNHLGPKTSEGIAERLAPDQYWHFLSWYKAVFMIRMTLHDKLDEHASTWQKNSRLFTVEAQAFRKLISCLPYNARARARILMNIACL